MFTKIPTVLRSKELLDKAFSRASKIEEPYHPKLEDKIRKEVQDRISLIEATLNGRLQKLVKKFPSADRIHPFYRDILDLEFDLNQYRISLSKVDRTSRKIVELSTEKIRGLRGDKKIDSINRKMREYYGRVSSLINNLSEDLLFLGKCRDFMRRVPELDMEIPTFLVAGMPNVGKSSLLARLSNATPKVAAYPFTTQSIFIAYMNIGVRRIQLIDTPGLLDRPMADRNDIEMNAILALKDIDSAIIFIFDVSSDSPYTKETQEALFEEIKRRFSKRMIRVQSKADISESHEEDICVSATTGEGMDSLIETMRVYMEKDVR